MAYFPGPQLELMFGPAGARIDGSARVAELQIDIAIALIQGGIRVGGKEYVPYKSAMPSQSCAKI